MRGDNAARQTKDYMKIEQVLKEQAAKSPAFRDVCLVFGARERDRAEITVISLMKKMEMEGFQHSKEDYMDCLAFLAQNGIGTIAKNRKGDIKGLIDIESSIMSIGEIVSDPAVLGPYKEKVVALREQQKAEREAAKAAAASSPEANVVPIVPAVPTIAPESGAQVLPMKKFKRGKKFSKITKSKLKKSEPKLAPVLATVPLAAAPLAAVPQYAEVRSDFGLVVSIRGVPVTINLPGSIPTNDIAALIQKLRA